MCTRSVSVNCSQCSSAATWPSLQCCFQLPLITAWVQIWVCHLQFDVWRRVFPTIGGATFGAWGGSWFSYFHCFSSLNYDEWVGGQRMVGDISFQKMYVCEDVLLSLCCWRAEFRNLTKLSVAIFHSFFRINATDRKRGPWEDFTSLVPFTLGTAPPFHSGHFSHRLEGRSFSSRHR